MIAFKHKISNYFSNKLKNVKSGKWGRQRFSLTCFIYRFLPLLGYDYQKLIEWKFILNSLPYGKRMRILDVGSAASLFIYELSRHGEIISMDSRKYFERLPSQIKFIQCDAMHLPFSDGSFNVITIISVIEHIGIGAYGDPSHRDGDLITMAELRRVLSSEGSVFLTTLIGNKYTVFPDERIYDRHRLSLLSNNFIIKQENCYIFRRRWVRASSAAAFNEPPHRFALACLELKK